MPPSNEPIDPKTPPESASAIEEQSNVQASDTGSESAPVVESVPDETPAQTRRRTTELSAQQLAATKREATRRGAAAETERLTQLATSRGYKTLDDMLAAVPGAAPADAGAPLEERTQRSGTKLKQLEGEHSLLQRKHAKAESALKALQVEVTLRESAYRADITDIDYAISILRKKVAGLAPAEAKSFQPVEFLKGLRVQHPYIFRAEPAAPPAATKIEDAPPPVREVPISTSPTARLSDTSIPTAPGPAAATRQEEDVPVDVMGMSTKDYQAYLKRKGIRDPRTTV